MERIEFKVEKLSTSYKNFSIKNVNFKLNSGDIMGLVGRSGSGKSTLIKTILGQKKPDSGYVNLFENGNPENFFEYIGYSPQANALYEFLTLQENMITFGRLHKMPLEKIMEAMNTLLKRLDLSKAKHKNIVQLSGGMQKRADLAVSLVHDPKVIILDEPFTGLDVSLQQFIWKLLRELAEKGRIIIISSHMLNDVQKNCNKYGLVLEGSFYNTEEIQKRLQGKIGLGQYLEMIFTQNLLNEDD